MTQEEKDLLLKDLCTRLPYKPQIKFSVTDVEGYEVCELLPEIITSMFFNEDIEIKPYLRTMDSMTEEEKREYSLTKTLSIVDYPTLESFDWLNAHHFDCRGLIDKGLALKATENMYN